MANRIGHPAATPCLCGGCPSCGVVDLGDCDVCGGTGRVVCRECGEGKGGCGECREDGTTDCPSCDGTGAMSRERAREIEDEREEMAAEWALDAIEEARR